MATALTFAALGFQALSTLQQSSAASAAGKAQQQQYDYQAAEANTAAGQARAASQRDVITQDRRTNIAMSNARAAAVAGGGSATDPGVEDITGRIAEEGSYRSMAALYQGEDTARNYETGANLDTWQGQQANTAGGIRSRAALFSGAGSIAGNKSFQTLLDKYG